MNLQYKLKMIKNCLHCKQDFEDESKSHCQKFCSIKCRSAFKRPLYRKWKEKNEAKLAEYQADYYKDNKDRRKQQSKERKFKNKESDRLWYKNYKRKKYKTDINYRLRSLLRSRLSNLLKGEFKTGSAVSDLGCSIEELKKYLESKFKPGMTWDNWGRDGWHIDHIKPLVAFDLSVKEEFLRAFHFSNLQPLWAKDNLSKGDKIV